MKGALIAYSFEKIIPIIKNAVFFHFMPESVTREIVIPSKNLKTETLQSGTEPVEKINFTAHFDASDLLNRGDTVAQMVGIGQQLAALEKLVYPITKKSSLVGAALDAVGDLIPNKKDGSTSPIPRLSYPPTLLVWGLTRLLPVVLTSLNITEQRYDKFLNPIRAEAAISLNVMQASPCMDKIAKAALFWTNNVKDSLALINFASASAEFSKEITDIVSF
jgi:hypothetical protein